MQELNLPNYLFSIKSNKNKLFIFDFIRKKEVLLTPEEWVRQHFLRYLVDEKKYPISLIAVEKKLKVYQTVKRTDIVVYNQTAKPEIIVECKAPNVALSQTVFDQIARYNLKLDARFLVVTNGLQHFYCQIDSENERYFFLEDIPTYSE